VPYYYYKYREDIPPLSRTASEGGSLRGWAHALSTGPPTHMPWLRWDAFSRRTSEVTGKGLPAVA